MEVSRAQPLRELKALTKEEKGPEKDSVMVPLEVLASMAQELKEGQLKQLCQAQLEAQTASSSSSGSSDEARFRRLLLARSQSAQSTPMTAKIHSVRLPQAVPRVSPSTPAIRLVSTSDTSYTPSSSRSSSLSLEEPPGQSWRYVPAQIPPQHPQAWSK